MPNDTIGNSQQSAAGQIQPVYFSPTTPSPSHSQHHAHHSSWPQQNMGPISPSLYGNVHQTYGLSPPPLVPLGVFNGQCPPNIYQPMDFRYGSPSMSPSSSPSHGGVQWTRSPEQRMQQPANHAFHHNGTISNFGVPRNTPTTVSTADIHSRSVSSSTHAGTFPSPLAPIEVQVYRDMCDKQLPQKHCVSGSVQELPVSENTGIDSHGHSSRNSNSTINFEIANPVTIPEAAKPTDPCNLFIKNLDDALVNTSEELKNLFEPYGAVASAHLATYHESKISRGFGFVAFTKAEDAAKAKEDLNNSLVGKKRVFVSYAERKEDRAKRLRSLFQGTSTDLCDGEDCKELVGQITQEIDTNKSGSAEIQQGEMNFKNSSENVSPNGTELQVPKISTLKDGVETVLHSHGGNNSRQAARDHAAIPNANQSGCNVEITTLVSATGRRDKGRLALKLILKL
jgi:RNA recognition motif-containing protein